MPREDLRDDGDSCVDVPTARPHPTRAAVIRVFLRWKRWAWLAALLLVALMTYRSVSAPRLVHVAVVQSVIAAETLGATGKVRGEKSSELGLSVSGIIRRIHVHEGDFVRAGSPILSVDGSELADGVDAARAAVSTAGAELARASRPPLTSEVAQARAELAQADTVGRAKIAQAQARLKDLQSGTRPQEVAQAQAQLQREKALLSKAESDLKRIQRLVQLGAIARANADDAQTNVETAQASVSAQQNQVDLLKSGSRPTQIAEANASVAEARASHATGVRAARERINSILALPRREDVDAARSRVAEAQANLQRAHHLGAKSDMLAPFDGVVADLQVEQGDSVSPGQKLVTFQEIKRPIIEVETDEENLSTLSPGQKAVVTADAYPGRTFTATLFDLGSMVNPERGTVKIKLRPDGPVSWLRPDLTVDVNIITHHRAKRVILPADTLTKAGGTSVVLAVRDDETIAVPVTAGAVGAKGVAISGDLRNGDLVVRNASLVGPGETVEVARN